MSVSRKLFFSVLFTFGFLNSTWAFDYSAEIQKAQERFKDVKDYPIVIFDQDELSWRLSQADALGRTDEDEDKRAQIIQTYIKEQSGLEITLKEARSFDNYVTVMKDSAFAMPLLEGSFNERGFKMCAVFPSSPNTNKRLEHERMLGLLTDEVYGELGYEDLNVEMKYEELAMFSLYHEISHCLDPEFMPRNYQGYEEAHNVHLSESYAEGLALLMLEQMGYEGMAPARGRMRMVYSRMMGRYFAQNPRLGFGNPMFTKGGVIYHLDPVLRAANEFIRYEFRKFENMTLEELMNVTIDLVEKSALDARTFYAVGSYLGSDDPEKVLADYREKAFNDSDLFFTAYEGLLIYSDYTNYVLSRFIQQDEKMLPETANKTSSVVERLGLCDSFRSGDQKAFMQEVLVERLSLREGVASASEQRVLAKSLNQVFETAASECQGPEDQGLELY